MPGHTRPLLFYAMDLLLGVGVLSRLRDNRHFIGYQVTRVETYAKLPDEVHVIGVGAVSERLHELLGTTGCADGLCVVSGSADA
jgi:hypothetical protein